jgi:hypothetical protein
MASKKNYIPQNAKEFDLFFKSITQYVAVKTASTPPEWTHIPKKAVDSLNDQYIAWYTAYGPTIKPHTPPETKERARVKVIVEKALREFINTYLRYHPDVTDQDRDNMKIPNRDLIRTHHDTVSELVEFHLEISSIRQVKAHFKVMGAEGKAKPAGYDGAVVVWDVLAKPPEEPDDLKRHELASRTPFAMKFKEAERGKTVYIALCWQNGKGITGEWSEVQSTIVP